MITVTGVDLRVGARLLLSGISFHISPGDRVGLIGRNGAGKTTLLNTLAGTLPPAAGAVTRTGEVGHLPQDSRAADPTVTVTDRILSARGLDRAVRALRRAEEAMTDGSRRAMDAYVRAEARFQAAGGYPAEAEAARVAAGLGLPARLTDRPLGALSGGQRRRVELARILFAEHGTLLLDEPTNHLDADAIAWLRTFLTNHHAGLVLISHDTSLLDATVNRVFHLDPRRATIDVHNTGWKAYLAQREADERRRTHERAGAERKAAALRAQAEKMRARVSTAVAARNMDRRADRMLADLEPVRRADKVARFRLPEPRPCGRIPLGTVGLTKSYGGHHVLRGVDLAVERGSRMVVLGPNGAGKTTLLRILAGQDEPDGGRVVHGHGLRLGYLAQEHDTLDPGLTVGEQLASAAPHLGHGEVRRVLGSFLFTGDDADKPVGALSGGEKTRLALAGLVHSGANVLLLDEPTNNLDPASP
ncbi:ABC-F family ATP-binding cassette domain-containing protein, partial [Streptomyces sp. NPDC006356]